MFFIRMADGRELLYVGDLMWSYRNIELVRSRPYGVANYFLGEDAVAVANQLRAVMTFAETNPDVEIVVSHDAERIENQVARGVLHLGLDLIQPQCGCHEIERVRIVRRFVRRLRRRVGKARYIRGKSGARRGT